jgi:hypothetical protein
MTRIAFGLAAALVFLLAAGARADTTVAISNIGTKVQSSGFNIDTHVDRVTYSDPVVVDVPAYGSAWEIRGMVSGIGWGGTGAVARAANRHYSYDVPFVARWPLEGDRKTLLVWHHGGGPGVVAMLQADKLLGAANTNRFTEDTGNYLIDVAALLDHCTYVSPGRRSMHRDGTFSAKYLPGEVPPLTQAEVNGIYAVLAGAPGTPGYTNPDIAAGKPVPVAISTDTPTFRDVDRALERVVADAARTRFSLRLVVSNSAGSVLSASMNFGRSVIGALSVRTGGNYLRPYDPSSGRIFDGFIFNGFVYNNAVERADAQFPISAPSFFLQGRADERYQYPIRMLYELSQKGVTLDGSTWVYEIKNLPHISGDNLVVVPAANQHGERFGAFAGAAITNMRALLSDGTPPPRSRIAGRIDASGALVIDVDGGATQRVAPILEDPALDSRAIDPQITPQTIGPAEAARWQYVTGLIDFENAAIAGPSVACRIGGYQIFFAGLALTPFSPATLDARYGCFDGYRQCVENDVQALEAARLYDPRVESAKETAARASALFDSDHCD